MNHFKIFDKIKLSKINHNIVCERQKTKKSSWKFVNLLDNFYGGYQRELVLFSKSLGDKYPMEECNLIGL